MSSLGPEITGRAFGTDLDPIAVSPRQTGQLLNIGQTRVWQLIKSGELETYKEGRSTKVTIRSIRVRHEGQLAAARGIEAAPQPGRRGRPRKLPRVTI
jgi:hypothetical protein